MRVPELELELEFEFNAIAELELELLNSTAPLGTRTTAEMRCTYPPGSVGRSVGMADLPSETCVHETHLHLGGRVHGHFFLVNTRNRCIHGQMSKNGQIFPVHCASSFGDFSVRKSNTAMGPPSGKLINELINLLFEANSWFFPSG